MAEATPDAPVLSDRVLNRTLLHRQMLLRRKRMTVISALEHLVGMQAQAPHPPYLGLWTRLTGFTIKQLSDLVAKRKAVRIALQRGTIHLVTAQDCLRLRPVLQPMLSQALNGTFGKKLSGLELSQVAAAGRKLVEQEPLTLGDIGKGLQGSFPGRDPFALANVVRALVPLVQTPPRGLWGQSGQAVHTTAELWLGAALEQETSPDALVLRYLAAFGPATVADIQEWCGLTRLSESVKRLRPRLRSFRNARGIELLDVAGAPIVAADVAAPPRLLPEFDNVLLAHADRSRIISEEHRRVVLTRNGTVKATILVDGTVSGTWAVDSTKAGAVLEVQPFRRLSEADREGLAAEASALLDFAYPGLAHAVTFAAAEG